MKRSQGFAAARQALAKSWIIATSLLLAAPGCSKPGRTLDPAELDFPNTFLFGTATAGFQVDMGCPSLPDSLCVDDASDWYAYSTDARLIERGSTHLSGDDPAAAGPGHWELFESDFDLVSGELQGNAFRMSIEWSRIFPEPTFGVSGHEALRALADPDALQTYHRMFDALRERGLTPLVTIHHYTMPLWIHDGVTCTLDWEACTARGWVDRESTVTEIAKYAGFVAREFGDDVDLWATQNEPLAVVLPGYLFQTLERTNPPARFLDHENAHRVFGAMVEAHARMYDAVEAADQGDADGDGSASEIGVILALSPVVPADPARPLDVEAARGVDYIWNQSFLDGAALGRLDENLDGQFEQRPDLDGRLDWIGVNYKTIVEVTGTREAPFPEISPLLTVNPLLLDFSEVRTELFPGLLASLQERYQLPMYITENNGQHTFLGEDQTEARLVAENLSWLAHALDQGIDVRGYFYWTLMDNIEWNRGMTGKRLGLYAVEPDDPGKERRARPTASVFAAIAGANAIPLDLAERYELDELRLEP